MLLIYTLLIFFILHILHFNHKFLFQIYIRLFQSIFFFFSSSSLNAVLNVSAKSYFSIKLIREIISNWYIILVRHFFSLRNTLFSLQKYTNGDEDHSISSLFRIPNGDYEIESKSILSHIK